MIVQDSQIDLNMVVETIETKLSVIVEGRPPTCYFCGKTGHIKKMYREHWKCNGNTRPRSNSIRSDRPRHKSRPIQGIHRSNTRKKEGQNTPPRYEQQSKKYKV